MGSPFFKAPEGLKPSFSRFEAGRPVQLDHGAAQFTIECPGFEPGSPAVRGRCAANCACTLLELQKGIEPLSPVWKTGASTHSATGANPPSESRTPICGLRARCISRQCLRGEHQMGRARREVGRHVRRAEARAWLATPELNRLLGGHNPALCQVSYASVALWAKA